MAAPDPGAALRRLLEEAVVSGAAKLDAATTNGRLLVKICGIRTLEDARFAVDRAPTRSASCSGT